jgi:uncharacterized damage-inducible protein DinB
MGRVTWIAPEVTRIDEPFVGDESAMLDGYLEWQRLTLLFKCAGLTGARLAERSAPPSNLSLLGLLRHLTDVERSWFRRRFGGVDLPAVYWREDRPDAAFEEIDATRAETEYAGLITEWELARRAVAGASLDETFITERWGEMSLRWIYLHMIEEYARHNGHADLLRQRIDGTVGA